MKTKMAAPNYGFGTASRKVFESNKTPGPGAYNSNMSTIDRQYAKTMFGGNRDLSLSTKNNPGPGAYNPSKSANNFVNVKFGHGPKGFNFKNENPGPGTYSGNYKNIRNKDPIIGIGTSKRRPLSGNNNPGPGNYNIP